MGIVINGRELADKMQDELKEEVEKLTRSGLQPGLVVLIVGEDPASQTYVKNKSIAAQRIGLHAKVDYLPETITESELLTRNHHW